MIASRVQDRIPTFRSTPASRGQFRAPCELMGHEAPRQQDEILLAGWAQTRCRVGKWNRLSKNKIVLILLEVYISLIDFQLIELYFHLHHYCYFQLKKNLHNIRCYYYYYCYLRKCPKMNHLAVVVVVGLMK